MALLQLKPPESLDFSHPEDWPKWKRRFEQFRCASGLHEQDDTKQISTLLYCLGEEAEEVLLSTNPTEDEKKAYDSVIEKFNTFFKVRNNVIYERARFNRWNQLESESAEQYIIELYKLAENCNYGRMKDEMIRDRLVIGIRDDALSRQLQLDPDLTLETAKQKVRQREAVLEQQQELRGTAGLEELRHPTFSRRSSKRDDTRKPRQHAAIRKPQQKQCTRCGNELHPRNRCPAKDAICSKCGKRGHYHSLCYSKEVLEIDNSDDSDHESFDVESAFLGAVDTSTLESQWTIKIHVNGKQVLFKVDTGAEVTAITEQTYLQLGKPPLAAPKKALYGPSSQSLEVRGQMLAKLVHNDLKVEQPLYVVKGLKRDLLGLPAIVALKVAARIDATTKASEIPDSILQKYPTIFNGLGNLGAEYEVKLKPGAKPHAIYAPRRVPLALRHKVKVELDKMEAAGVISRVEEPTSWCAGMVVVPKKTGSVRICVDLKRLNESVLREVHPLPQVDDTLAQLHGAAVFSKLDANSGFWQIPLAPQSRLLTTFITPYGRYCFNKLPFGITSAPEHFQRRMSEILEGLDGVLCLIDDVLIWGRNAEEHNKRLTAALDRIQKAGATLNPSKCEFNKSQISFLGHIVDKNGICPDPLKVSAVLNMRAPTNITELRRFMGMVNQLGKFSKNLAELAQPIRGLLSTKTTWVWNKVQEEAFARIKEEITHPAVLALYNPDAEMKISADASSYGLGAVLMQRSHPAESWRPVVFASRYLTETEKRYAQIEKEALAVTWASEKFANYILGKRYTIETDHKPLVPLLGAKHLDSLPPRILRFRLRLARFDYETTHVPGKLMYTSDTLSRAPMDTMENDANLQEEAESMMEAHVAPFASQ